VVRLALQQQRPPRARAKLMLLLVSPQGESCLFLLLVVVV
jgi:hypothetical protein